MSKPWDPSTHDDRAKATREGIRKWLASLTPEQREERRLKHSRVSKERWAKVSQARKEEIVAKIRKSIEPNREMFRHLKKNWWATATEEQKSEARRKMAEARREWWRAMSDEERKTAVNKIHQKAHNRKITKELLKKAARELLAAVPDVYDTHGS